MSTPVVGMLAVVDSASAAGDAIPISKLVDAIKNPATLLPAREAAAVELIDRNTPDASAQADVILKTGSPRAQIAIARALAKTANPDPGFIGDLQNLMGADATMTQAAALALANYDGHPEVFNALRAFADNNGNAMNIRIAVISAMGGIVDKAVAQYLAGLLGPPNQTAAIQNAATDALGELAGISSNGNDIQLWQQWWNGVKSLTPDQFRSQILGVRFKQLQERNSRFTESASGHLRNNYLDVLRLDKGAAANLLVNYLNDDTPEIRTVGVDLISDDPFKIEKSVRKKLLSMTGDPDDGVRLKVVNVLLQANDHSALQSLIAQVKIEKNLQIKSKIAQVLGKLADLDAIPPLIDMLHDKHPETITAAARAISGDAAARATAADLGSKLRASDPAKADQVCVDLRHIVDTSNGPGTDEMRAACVSALATLRDKQSFDLFRQLAQPGETSEVRQAALRGLGNLGDTHADETVADQLDDKDRRVRYEAAVALQTVATPNQAQFIFQRMKHTPADDDPDKDVGDALWIAFQNLYAKESPDDLNRWATDLADAPDKRLVTLQRLGDALAAAHDDKGVAQTEQTIAEAMVAVKPPRYADAIASLDKALDYWRGAGKGDSDQLEALIGARLDDTLSAGQYDDATKFAAKQIAADKIYQQAVGSRIKNKAEELSAKSPADAKALIDAALQMNPPLDGRYVDQLHTIQAEMKQREAAPPG